MLWVAVNKWSKSGFSSLPTEVGTAIIKILQFESVFLLFVKERLDENVSFSNLFIFEASISKPTVGYFSPRAITKGKPIFPNPMMAIWGLVIVINSSNYV